MKEKETRPCCEECRGDNIVENAPSWFNCKRTGECICHITPSKNYEKNYSHLHCWEQDPPSACGQELEDHKQCCLCDTTIPVIIKGRGGPRNHLGPAGGYCVDCAKEDRIPYKAGRLAEKLYTRDTILQQMNWCLKTSKENLDRGNIMIAYDMDSRYYALKHLLEKLK